MREGLRNLFHLRPGETAAALWAGGLFFLLASDFVLRPIRDALPLDGDPTDLPHLSTATFLTMFAVTPVRRAMVRRWPRRQLVPICYHAFFVQLVALFAIIGSGVAPVLMGQVFYAWTSVFNLFVVSVFWSLAADMFTAEQARRLFGPIAAGGTLGALVGPTLTATLVDNLGVDGMLLVSGGLLEAAVLCDRYLLLICGFVLCTTIAATFLYLEQAKIAKAAYLTARPAPRSSPRQPASARSRRRRRWRS